MDDLDCEETAFNDAYMTCDGDEEESYEEIEIYKDFDIYSVGSATIQFSRIIFKVVRALPGLF